MSDRDREGGVEDAPEALQFLQTDRRGRTDNRRWRYAMEDLARTPFAGPGVWKQVGPSPLLVEGEQLYQGVGPNSGEIVDVAIDPTGADAPTLYAATNSGGVWRSPDGGVSWQALGDFLPSTSVGAVALDAGDPATVYAGTGNLFEGASGMPKSAGLFKSVDSGRSWAQVATPLGRGRQDVTAASNVAGGVRVTVAGHGYVTGDTVVAVGLPGVAAPRNEATVTRVDADRLRLDGLHLNAAYGGAGAHLFDGRPAPFLADRGIVRMVSPAPGVLLVGTDSGLFLSVDGGRNFGANAPAYDDGRPVRGGFISALELDQGLSRVLEVQGATPADPIVVTAHAHGFQAGDRVFVGGVETNRAANGGWVVDRIDDDTFSLRDSSGNGVGAVSGFVIGPAHPRTLQVEDASNPAAPHPIVVRATGHRLVTGDVVAITAVGGNTAANGSWQIRVLDAETFELVGWRGSGAYAAGTGTIDAPPHAPPQAITAAQNVTGAVELTVAAHGLVDGDRVGVDGLPGIAAPGNTGTVRRIGDDVFRVSGLRMNAAYGGAGATVSGPSDSWNTVYFVSAGRVPPTGGAPPTDALNPDRGLFRLTLASTNELALSDNLLAHRGGPGTTFGRVAFAQSLQPRRRVLYASVQDRDAAPIYVGLFRSDDLGQTWALRPALRTRMIVDNATQTNYDLTVGVDPQEPDRVYAGFQQLWRSIDGGRTFPPVTPAAGGGDLAASLPTTGRSPSTGLLHWDHHELVFLPATHWRWDGGAPVHPTPFLVGTDGGVARAEETAGTMRFVQLNEGLATSLLRGIDIGRGDGRNAFTYGGMQDTGTAGHRDTDGGPTWVEGIDGDGGPVAVDPADPHIVFGFDDDGFMRTTNGGERWFLAGFAGEPIVTGVANTNPVEVTTTGHPFRTGDVVGIAGVTGGGGLANGAATITVVDANVFRLNGKNGTAVAAFDPVPSVSGGRLLRAVGIVAATLAAPIVVETDTPHGCATGDRVRVDAVLGNTAANNTDGNPLWTATVIDDTHLSLDGSDGSLSTPYVAGSGRLRGPRTQGSVPIQLVTNANPIVVTAPGHGFVSGDVVTVTGVRGTTNANCADNQIAVVDANSFALVGRAGNAAFVRGPRVTGPSVGRGLAADPRSRVSLVPNGANPATTIFVSAGQVLSKSVNGGITFVPMRTFGAEITALASPAADRLWVGLAGDPGRVAFSRDGGSHFLGSSDHFVDSPGSHGTIAAIAVDPTDPNHVAVVAAGYSETDTRRRTRHCFVTTTGGIAAGGAAAWTEVGGAFDAPSGNLPDLPALSAAWDTTGAPSLLVASDGGILRLGDDGHWQRVGPNLPNVSCQTVVADNTVDPPVIRVGTYGRSAWEWTVPTGASLVVRAELGFGECAVGSSQRRPLVLHSVGGADVTVDHVDVPDGDFTLDPAPALPLVLASGERASFDVVFAPSENGLRGAILQVGSDDPDHGLIEAKATGFGVAAGEPRLEVRSFLEFGGVRTAAPATIPLELRNVGLGDLVITDLALDPSGSAAFSLPAPPALPVTIPAGGSQSVDVRFAPTANGTVGTSLQIVAGARNAAAVRVTGIGSTTGAGLLATLLDGLGAASAPGSAVV